MHSKDDTMDSALRVALRWLLHTVITSADPTTAAHYADCMSDMRRVLCMLCADDGDDDYSEHDMTLSRYRARTATTTTATTTAPLLLLCSGVAQLLAAEQLLGTTPPSLHPFLLRATVQPRHTRNDCDGGDNHSDDDNGVAATAHATGVCLHTAAMHMPAVADDDDKENVRGTRDDGDGAPCCVRTCERVPACQAMLLLVRWLCNANVVDVHTLASALQCSTDLALLLRAASTDATRTTSSSSTTTRAAAMTAAQSLFAAQCVLACRLQSHTPCYTTGHLAVLLALLRIDVLTAVTRDAVRAHTRRLCADHDRHDAALDTYTNNAADSECDDDDDEAAHDDDNTSTLFAALEHSLMQWVCRVLQCAPLRRPRRRSRCCRCGRGGCRRAHTTDHNDEEDKTTWRPLCRAVMQCIRQQQQQQQQCNKQSTTHSSCGAACCVDVMLALVLHCYAPSRLPSTTLTAVLSSCSNNNDTVAMSSPASSSSSSAVHCALAARSAAQRRQCWSAVLHAASSLSVCPVMSAGEAVSMAQSSATVWRLCVVRLLAHLFVVLTAQQQWDDDEAVEECSGSCSSGNDATTRKDNAAAVVNNAVHISNNDDDDVDVMSGGDSDVSQLPLRPLVVTSTPLSRRGSAHHRDTTRQQRQQQAPSSLLSSSCVAMSTQSNSRDGMAAAATTTPTTARTAASVAVVNVSSVYASTPAHSCHRHHAHDDDSVAATSTSSSSSSSSLSSTMFAVNYCHAAA